MIIEDIKLLKLV